METAADRVVGALANCSKHHRRPLRFRASPASEPTGKLSGFDPRGATTLPLERRRRQRNENLPAAPIHTLGLVSLAVGLESSRSVQAATAGGGVISISGRNSRNGR